MTTENSISKHQYEEEFAIDPSEVNEELSEEDIIYIQEFQFAWQEFLRQNPAIIPPNIKSSRIEALKEKLKAKEAAKREADNELRQQYEFFVDSQEALEETYATEIVFAKNLQKVIHERLLRQHAEIQLSKQIWNRLNRWDDFVKRVDTSAVQYAFPKSTDNRMRPTARALALVDPEGDEQDTLLRALRMDHVLMKTEIKLLHQELESIELSCLNLDFIGKFLTEFNIWGILMKQHAKEQSVKVKARQEALKIITAKDLGAKKDKSEAGKVMEMTNDLKTTKGGILKIAEFKKQSIHQEQQQNLDNFIVRDEIQGIEEEKTDPEEVEENA